MNHWLVAPVVLPLAAGSILVLVERARPRWQAPLSLAATGVLLLVGLKLVALAAEGGVQAYLLGNWPAPFGIALALDRLSALLLLLAAMVAFASLIYALAGWHRAGAHFHALFQFQLMGINGAFLTADLFNLFVFFEVLLAASYALLLHGGGRERLRAGIHYVVFNLSGSALFLIAVSLLYGVTGTLNMADLALRVSQVPVADAVLVRAAGLMLLVVFLIKGAILPLYFWLPTTYAAASAPVAALFAILTKVGIYSVMRMFTLVFGEGAGTAAALAWPWLLPLASATLLLASLGVVAATTLGRMTGYLVIASAGTLLLAVSIASESSLAAALYYLIHSTLVAALLFLLADLIRRGRGAAGDGLWSGPALAQPALLGSLFFVAAVAVAGLPPLAGFLGKLLLLQSIEPRGAGVWAWSIVLGAGLLTLIGLSRAGSTLFWNTDADADPVVAGRAQATELLALSLLLGASLALAVAAAPVQRYTQATAQQLLAPVAYAKAVLGLRPVARAGVRP
jgi:multicomponent K+:H+ antiporter subunit D